MSPPTEASSASSTASTANPAGSEREPTGLMPALFVGHGSPMNALESNRYSRAWADFGGRMPRPRAVLAISAHWYINATAVTAMAAPRTIHDFYGFPDELFALDYPAPGDPELAAEIADVVKPTWVGQDADSWGLDHGTWSVLVHMFPDASIPVLQLAIDATKDADYHLNLGAALAPLRERGVAIVASGNVVHNLRRIDWQRPDHGDEWAVAFNQCATSLMSERPGDITELVGHEHYDMAAPTPDHLIPLYYIAGLAAAAGTGTVPAVDHYAMGSLSMTSHLLQLDQPRR